MIIAYAQSKNKQGVDAAAGGRMVSAESSDFAALREKATQLNFSKTKASRVGNVEVRYGKGVVRLESFGDTTSEQDVSPVVVAAHVENLLRDIDGAANLAVESLSAIGRKIDSSSISAGFEEGERLHRSFRARRYLAAALAVTVAVGLAFWASRGSLGPWSR